MSQNTLGKTEIVFQPVQLFLLAPSVAAAKVHDIVVTTEWLELMRIARTILVTLDIQILH
jgi:hypothetical protein